MFDLVFDAMQAWNQIGLVIMACVFLLIGGAILADSMYWRIKGVRTKGRIVALKVKRDSIRARKRLKHSKSINNDPGTIPNESVGKKEQKKLPLIFFLMFGLFPMVFMVIGLWTGYKYFDLTQNGKLAHAVVVDNESSYDSDSGTSYTAILSFTDDRGYSWKVKDNISSGGNPSYETGTKLDIYYDPRDPRRFVIDSFWHNMVLPIVFIAFSSLFMGLALFIYKVNQRENSSHTYKDNNKGKKNYAGEMYYPVYEYKSPHGERMEYVGTMGSNMVLGQLPGKRVTLLVMPDNPAKVRKLGYIGIFFGIVFLLPGIFIAYVAFSSFKATLGAIFMIMAIAGFITFKIIRAINKIPEDIREKGWDMLKSGKIVDELSKIEYNSPQSNDGDKKGYILSSQEIRERVKYWRKYYRVFAYVSIIISLGLFTGAYYAGNSMIELLQNGVRTQGKVVDINSRYSSSGSNNSSSYTYHAVVEFTNSNGNKVKFEDSVGVSTPIFDRGDDVTVLYDPNKTSGAIIDRGLLNWGLSAGLLLAALFMLWVALHTFRVSSYSNLGRVSLTHI